MVASQLPLHLEQPSWRHLQRRRRRFVHVHVLGLLTQHRQRRRGTDRTNEQAGIQQNTSMRCGYASSRDARAYKRVEVAFRIFPEENVAIRL